MVWRKRGRKDLDMRSLSKYLSKRKGLNRANCNNASSWKKWESRKQEITF
jgi:hypothetical protein